MYLENFHRSLNYFCLFRYLSAPVKAFIWLGSICILYILPITYQSMSFHLYKHWLGPRLKFRQVSDLCILCHFQNIDICATCHKSKQHSLTDFVLQSGATTSVYKIHGRWCHFTSSLDSGRFTLLINGLTNTQMLSSKCNCYFDVYHWSPILFFMKDIHVHIIRRTKIKIGQNVTIPKELKKTVH